MTLHLPDFRQDSLQGIAFCSTIHADNGVGISGLPFKAYAEYDASDGKALLVVQIEPSNDDEPDGVHFHYHVDVDRIEIARHTIGFTKMKVDKLKGIMEGLAGLSSSSYVDGKYSIEKRLLPSGGIISTMLSVSTDVGNLRLEQRGAKFDIDGDYFRGLVWNLEEHEDSEDCVSGRLEAYESVVLDDNYLIRSAELMQKGIMSLIFELEDKQNNDGDSTEMHDTKKKAASE